MTHANFRLCDCCNNRFSEEEMESIEYFDEDENEMVDMFVCVDCYQDLLKTHVYPEQH